MSKDPQPPPQCRRTLHPAVPAQVFPNGIFDLLNQGTQTDSKCEQIQLVRDEMVEKSVPALRLDFEENGKWFPASRERILTKGPQEQEHCSFHADKSQETVQYTGGSLQDHWDLGEVGGWEGQTNQKAAQRIKKTEELISITNLFLPQDELNHLLVQKGFPLTTGNLGKAQAVVVRRWPAARWEKPWKIAAVTQRARKPQSITPSCISALPRQSCCKRGIYALLTSFHTEVKGSPKVEFEDKDPTCLFRVAQASPWIKSNRDTSFCIMFQKLRHQNHWISLKRLEPYCQQPFHQNGKFPPASAEDRTNWRGQLAGRSDGKRNVIPPGRHPDASKHSDTAIDQKCKEKSEVIPKKSDC